MDGIAGGVFNRVKRPGAESLRGLQSAHFPYAGAPDLDSGRKRAEAETEPRASRRRDQAEGSVVEPKQFLSAAWKGLLDVNRIAASGPVFGACWRDGPCRRAEARARGSFGGLLGCASESAGGTGLARAGAMGRAGEWRRAQEGPSAAYSGALRKSPKRRFSAVPTSPLRRATCARPKNPCRGARRFTRGRRRPRRPPKDPLARTSAR